MIDQPAPSVIRRNPARLISGQALRLARLAPGLVGEMPYLWGTIRGACSAKTPNRMLGEDAER